MESDLRKRRKNTSVDLQDKLKALEEYKNGATKTVIARKLGVHISTVAFWIKNEESLQEWKDTHIDNLPKYQKRLRKPCNDEVDKATWIWYQDRRQSGCPPDGPTIRDQAIRFAKALTPETDFNGSQGWLSKWKRRHGLSVPRLKETKDKEPGGDNDDDDDVDIIELPDEPNQLQKTPPTDYIKIFAQIVENEGLVPDQVFNCDKTGLIFRQMPRSSSQRDLEAPGCSLQKERVTIMACSNASGTLKLPLVLIEKSSHQTEIATSWYLPVSYKTQKNAWLTNDLLENWFYDEFVPTVSMFLLAKRLPAKAVLFIDYCNAHPLNLRKGDIRVECFPPDITFTLQPMAQACLQHVKILYRLRLISHVIDRINAGDGLAEVLKKVTIREVVFWISTAWTSMTNSNIIKLWKPLWPKIVKIFVNILEPEDSETYDFNHLVPEDLMDQFYQALNSQIHYKNLDLQAISDWLYPTSSLHANECLTEEEILENVTDSLANKNHNQNNENFNKKSGSKEITHLHALHLSIDQLILHCEGNSHYTAYQIIALKAIRENMKMEIILPKL